MGLYETKITTTGMTSSRAGNDPAGFRTKQERSGRIEVTIPPETRSNYPTLKQTNYPEKNIAKKGTQPLSCPMSHPIVLSCPYYVRPVVFSRRFRRLCRTCRSLSLIVARVVAVVRAVVVYGGGTKQMAEVVEDPLRPCRVEHNAIAKIGRGRGWPEMRRGVVERHTLSCIRRRGRAGGPLRRFSLLRRLEREDNVILGRPLDRCRHSDRDVETGHSCRTSVAHQPHGRRHCRPVRARWCSRRPAV